MYVYGIDDSHLDNETSETDKYDARVIMYIVSIHIEAFRLLVRGWKPHCDSSLTNEPVYVR
jgi:hypothetical protein